MLSEAEQITLQSWRRDGYYHPGTMVQDMRKLALAVDRLYPPGWDTPVTLEALVGIGGKVWIEGVSVKFSDVALFEFWPSHLRGGALAYVEIACDNEMLKVPKALHPRNMLEAKQMLERCDAIKEPEWVGRK